MSNDIILVKQLPIVEDSLTEIKSEVSLMTSETLKLQCTEETLQEVKKAKSELKKRFDELEAARKKVKKAVLAPYEEFETRYLEIKDLFLDADAQLKAKIQEVEDSLIKGKVEEINRFFVDYATSRDVIKYVSFEKSGIKILKSKSEKALKDECRNYIDHIVNDIETMRTMNHRREIFYEYRSNGFNLSEAIKVVNVRLTEIKKEEVEKPNDNATVPDLPILPPELPPKDEKVYATKFKVWGTKEQLKDLKDFLKNGGYRYEQ